MRKWWALYCTFSKFFMHMCFNACAGAGNVDLFNIFGSCCHSASAGVVAKDKKYWQPDWTICFPPWVIYFFQSVFYCSRAQNVIEYLTGKYVFHLGSLSFPSLCFTNLCNYQETDCMSFLGILSLVSLSWLSCWSVSLFALCILTSKSYICYYVKYGSLFWGLVYYACIGLTCFFCL